MKLLYSTSSPFVRKIVLVAQALGLDSAIERLPSAANPLKRDPRITAHNPLGKVPTLITDDGLALFESKLIVEYLCALAPNDEVLPSQGPRRWRLLRQQALADGVTEAAVALRYENVTRPEALRWAEWTAGLMAKVEASLQALQNEQCAPDARDVLDVGQLATVAALGYLDFRYADWNWRGRYPALAAAYAPILARPQVRATEPVVAT